MAPIGLYSWYRWNHMQPITMQVPMWLMPTGPLLSAHDNNL